jgi:hypothetical protein
MEISLILQLLTVRHFTRRFTVSSSSLSLFSRLQPLALFSVLACFASPGPALAQPPPAPETCDQQDSGARIKCKFGNIIAQQQSTAEMISSMPETSEAQRRALTNKAGQASRAHTRTSEVDFKQLTKKASPQCQIREIEGDGIGNDDGVCKGNEDCLEALNDQIGNDDGICHPRNGRNRETCVEICDAEAINSDPDNFDDDPNQESLGRDVEEQLDEVTEQYVEINDMLGEDAQLRAAVSILAANGDSCAAVITARSNDILLAALLAGDETLRGIADIFERICDQSVLGSNASIACVVLETAAALGSLANATFQSIEGQIDSDTMDQSFACLKGVSLSVGASGGSADTVHTKLDSLRVSAGENDAALDSIQVRLDTLQQRVTELQQEITNVKTLLNTPQGRRDEFPTSATSTTSR